MVWWMGGDDVSTMMMTGWGGGRPRYNRVWRWWLGPRALSNGLQYFYTLTLVRIEDGREEAENNVGSSMTKMIEIKISNPNGDLKHVAYHLNFYENYAHYTHDGKTIIILIHQRQKWVSGLMMMVMVKVDDDQDNDEGGFGIGRVVRISQVYQLRICLGRIPIQPPYHILSFHPTTKTMLLSSPNSASLCPNFSSSSHSSPSTQPTMSCLETVSWFQRCSDFDWKVSSQANP